MADSHPEGRTEGGTTNPPERPRQAPSDGPWHPGHQGAGPVQILNLLFEYRAAEQRLRATTRDSLRMGETDLLALRYLLEARSTGKVMRQKDLAPLLGVSAASVSGLIDRLARDGYLRRIPHPEDRRSVAIELTATTEDNFRASLHQIHARMVQATEALTPGEQSTVARFLTGLIHALDHPDTE